MTCSNKLKQKPLVHIISMFRITQGFNNLTKTTYTPNLTFIDNNYDILLCFITSIADHDVFT